MIYAVILVHLLLFFFNYQVSKSFLYPPAAFVSLWLMALLFITMLGDFFFPISEFTLLIFTLGSLAFSFGGFVSLLQKYKVSHQVKSVNRRTSQFLDIALFVLIIIFPFYVKKLHELSALSGIDDFWIGLRAQSSIGTKEEAGFGVFGYIVGFANFAALAALSENLRHSYSKRKTYLLIILVFLYGLISTARVGTLTLLLALSCVLILHRKFNLKTVIMTAVVFVSLFSVPAVVLEKGGSKEYSFSENVTSLRENLQIYALGGLVAFDQSVTNPGRILSNDRTFMFFISLFKALGFDIKTESTNLDYSSTPWLTNVYTIYFPYYSDLGLFGLVAAMFLLGSILTMFYRFAILGGPEFILLYSFAFSYLMVSLFTEAFITSLSYWIQLAAYAFVCYKLPKLPFLKKYRVSLN
jgi:oligosaccharide repeat unit polymerase